MSWIVFDGIDGCGKTTMLNMAHEYLLTKDKRYTHILTTREPTYGQYGSKARMILKEDDDPLKNADKCLELFVKDRYENFMKIAPLIDLGWIVLQDRGKYSTLAYQGSQGISITKIINAHQYLNKNPDLVLILDIPSSVSLKRGKGMEKFESNDFLEKVRIFFLNMDVYFKDENIKIIDANRKIEDVFEDVKNEIDKVIPY